MLHLFEILRAILIDSNLIKSSLKKLLQESNDTAVNFERERILTIIF